MLGAEGSAFVAELELGSPGADANKTFLLGTSDSLLKGCLNILAGESNNHTQFGRVFAWVRILIEFQMGWRGLIIHVPKAQQHL